MSKNKFQGILFEPKPQGGYRFKYEEDKKIILNSKTGYTLYDDKLDYPSIFENIFKVKVFTTNFDFSFKVEGKENINGDTRYRWNNADIRSILKLFCSPDDRRIVLPSGIHDYMLENKFEIYETIKDKCTMQEYRRLTSEIFIYLCTQQGFSTIKAKMMGNLVDYFQKNWQKKKWRLPNA